MVSLRPDRQHGRRPPRVLLAGAVGSAALALSMTGTLSAFTAQIQNTTNTGATGMLAMQEILLDAAGNPTATVCKSNDGTAASVAANSATCATIDKYGGTAGVGLTPGGAAHTTKISIQNTGNVPATSFTLTPGACTATPGSINGGASTGVVCGKFKVIITSGSTTVYSGFASAMPASINILSVLGQNSVAAGASVPFTFSVQLDSSADNTYAGFTISQSLAWTFTA